MVDTSALKQGSRKFSVTFHTASLQRDIVKRYNPNDSALNNLITTEHVIITQSIYFQNILYISSLSSSNLLSMFNVI